MPIRSRPGPQHASVALVRRSARPDRDRPGRARSQPRHHERWHRVLTSANVAAAAFVLLNVGLLGGATAAQASASPWRRGSGRTARLRPRAARRAPGRRRRGAPPREDRALLGARELRGDRQEQLVDGPRSRRFGRGGSGRPRRGRCRSPRSARSHSSARARSTRALVPDDRRSGSRSPAARLSEAVEDTTSPVAVGEEGGVPGEVRGSRRRSRRGGRAPGPSARGSRESRVRERSARSARRASSPRRSSPRRRGCAGAAASPCRCRCRGARSGRRSSRGRRGSRRSS